MITTLKTHMDGKMTRQIRNLLRGALLILSVATGAAIISAAPGQAIQDPDDNCAEITGGSPDGPVECVYCEILDSGTCIFLCANGGHGSFCCSEFDDDNEEEVICDDDDDNGDD